MYYFVKNIGRVYFSVLFKPTLYICTETCRKTNPAHVLENVKSSKPINSTCTAHTSYAEKRYLLLERYVDVVVPFLTKSV